MTDTNMPKSREEAAQIMRPTRHEFLVGLLSSVSAVALVPTMMHATSRRAWQNQPKNHIMNSERLVSSEQKWPQLEGDGENWVCSVYFNQGGGWVRAVRRGMTPYQRTRLCSHELRTAANEMRHIIWDEKTEFIPV